MLSVPKMIWIYLLFLFMALVAVAVGEHSQVPSLLFLALVYLLIDNIPARDGQGYDILQQGDGEAFIPLSIEETSQNRELDELADYFRRMRLDGVQCTPAEGGQSSEAQGLEAGSATNLPAHSEPMSLQGPQVQSLQTSVSTQTTSSMMADSQTDSEWPHGTPNPNYSKLKEELRELQRGQLCGVCLIRPRNIVFNPCCHLATCTPCAEEIMNRDKKCCICRRVIQEYHKLYIS